jgi:translocation and assembly module TamA
VLDDMSVEGNRRFSEAQLEERLALVETADWPWADPQVFDRGTLAGDRRRLLRFYRAKGYYDAKVKSRVVPKGDRVDVVFVVDEGPPTVVQDVTLAGVDALPAEVRARLRGAPLPLVRGAPIDEDLWNDTKAEVAKRLRDEGYADARVGGHVEVDAANRQAWATVEAEPGPRLSFGRLVIVGAVHVPRETIRETVETSLRSGGRYDEGKIAAAQQALFDLGVFGGVRVSRGATDEKTGTVPVIVALRESPFRTVRVGGGAGIDPVRQEARASAEFTHRNFFGGLRRLSFENRFGYAFLSKDAPLKFLAPEKEGVVGTSALDFTQPNLVARRVDGNLRLEYERGLEEAYSFDAIRGRVGFPVRLARSLTFTPSFNLQLYDVLETETGGLALSGRPELSADCNSQVGGRGDASKACILAYLEERIAWDRRDDPIRTGSGWYAALALQQGTSALGSKFDYQAALADLRAFVPLPYRTVLALRLKGGLLFPKQGQVSPIMERFYGGGGSDVRSFGTRRLSPQAVRAGACEQTLPDGTRVLDVAGCAGKDGLVSSGDTVSVGGDGMLEGSAELRVPIWGDLGVVAFVDAGNVARHVPDDLDVLASPIVAVGGGLRYHTLFGPVRLDFGYRVAGKPVRVWTGDASYPVDETPYSLLFSIGEAF